VIFILEDLTFLLLRDYNVLVRDVKFFGGFTEVDFFSFLLTASQLKSKENAYRPIKIDRNG